MFIKIKGIVILANTSLGADSTLFFLIKNVIMICEDCRRIRLIYNEVKVTRAKVANKFFHLQIA